MTFASSPRPTRSPWGTVQHAEELLSGVWVVDTASHGGVLITPERRRAMPDALRRRALWYEEDCEWCLPVIAFADEFVAAGKAKAVAAAERSFARWCPDEHERYRGKRPVVTTSEGR